MNPKISKEILRDSEGVEVGSPLNYIQRLKDAANNKTPSVPLTISQGIHDTPEPRAIPRLRTPMPEKWSKESVKDVLIHFYLRLGDLTCTDFNGISAKVAASINRYYHQTTTPSDILRYLERLVTIADIDKIVPQQPLSPRQASRAPEKEKIKVSLNTGKYEFMADLEPLSDDQKDLVMFLDTANLCFSSDGYDFYLALHPKHKNAFDSLFKFNAQEQMMVQMFKEQLNDEHKAKKMVLLSRMINKPQRKKKKKKTVKKKIASTEGLTGSGGNMDLVGLPGVTGVAGTTGPLHSLGPQGLKDETKDPKLDS